MTGAFPHIMMMMLGSKGALAPFQAHDIVLELALKYYIMCLKMARSAFDP